MWAFSRSVKPLCVTSRLIVLGLITFAEHKLGSNATITKSAHRISILVWDSYLINVDAQDLLSSLAGWLSHCLVCPKIVGRFMVAFETKIGISRYSVKFVLGLSHLFSH